MPQLPNWDSLDDDHDGRVYVSVILIPHLQRLFIINIAAARL